MNDTASTHTPPTAPPRTSRLAICSLILGILGFLILPALAGLVCGIVAMVQIQRSAGALKGWGIALAGTIVSGLMVMLIPFVAIALALVLPALAKAKDRAQNIQGMNNAKQICLALHLYADDSKELFPSGTNWCDPLKQYLGGSTRAFLRPGSAATDDGTTSHYGFNAQLGGLKVDQIDPSTVMIFELDQPAWNVAGGPDLMRLPTGWGDTVVVGFADGHTEAIGPGPRLDSLRWNP